MLVLSRNIGEVIVVELLDGRKVKISIIDIAHNTKGNLKVCVGIDAPRDIIIYRKEIEDQFIPTKTTPEPPHHR